MPCQTTYILAYVFHNVKPHLKLIVKTFLCITVNSRGSTNFSLNVRCSNDEYSVDTMGSVGTVINRISELTEPELSGLHCIYVCRM